MKMDNAEEIFHFLEEFSKRKPKTIPQELNDYLAYVARTGDPVYQWALVKALFKEKLLNVITEFYETTPGVDIPPYPNVDPFNYDTMKNSLLERLDSFTSAPFTVQRICELLTYPRKQYNRVDKFMRAIEKNILVVSTREPGIQRHIEAENGEPMEPIVNGSDNNSEYNVDVEMEDMSWKENSDGQQSSEPQPSSSDTHISVDDIEARLKAKQETPMDTQDKVAAQYESVTPPELNVTTDDKSNETKAVDESSNQQPTTSTAEEPKIESEIPTEPSESTEKPKLDIEMSSDTPTPNPTLIIPEIKVDDAEMTEQKLSEQASIEEKPEPIELAVKEPAVESDSIENKLSVLDDQQITTDESSSDSNPKEEMDSKLMCEVQTSSEESSSSSDNTDGNSNSPKTVESNTDNQEESSQSDSNMEESKEDVQQPEPEKTVPEKEPSVQEASEVSEIQTDNYSISDVKSELPQPPAEPIKAEETPASTDKKSELEKEADIQKESSEVKMDSNETENEISVENPSS